VANVYDGNVSLAPIGYTILTIKKIFLLENFGKITGTTVIGVASFY